MKCLAPSDIINAYLRLCQRLGKEVPTVREMSRRLGLSAAQVRYGLRILKEKADAAEVREVTP